MGLRVCHGRSQQRHALRRCAGRRVAPRAPRSRPPHSHRDRRRDADKSARGQPRHAATSPAARSISAHLHWRKSVPHPVDEPRLLAVERRHRGFRHRRARHPARDALRAGPEEPAGGRAPLTGQRGQPATGQVTCSASPDQAVRVARVDVGFGRPRPSLPRCVPLRPAADGRFRLSRCSAPASGRYSPRAAPAGSRRHGERPSRCGRDCPAGSRWRRQPGRRGALAGAITP